MNYNKYGEHPRKKICIFKDQENSQQKEEDNDNQNNKDYQNNQYNKNNQDNQYNEDHEINEQNEYKKNNQNLNFFKMMNHFNERVERMKITEDDNSDEFDLSAPRFNCDNNGKAKVFLLGGCDFLLDPDHFDDLKEDYQKIPKNFENTDQNYLVKDLTAEIDFKEILINDIQELKINRFYFNNLIKIGLSLYLDEYLEPQAVKFLQSILNLQSLKQFFVLIIAKFSVQPDQYLDKIQKQLEFKNHINRQSIYVYDSRLYRYGFDIFSDEGKINKLFFYTLTEINLDIQQQESVEILELHSNCICSYSFLNEYLKKLRNLKILKFHQDNEEKTYETEIVNNRLIFKKVETQPKMIPLQSPNLNELSISFDLFQELNFDILKQQLSTLKNLKVLNMKFNFQEVKIYQQYDDGSQQQADESQQQADESQQQDDGSQQQGDECQQQGDESLQQGDESQQQGDESQQQGEGSQQQGDRSQQQGDRRQQQSYAILQQDDRSQQLSYASQQQDDGGQQQGYRRYQQGYASQQQGDGRQQQSQACQQQDDGGQQQGYRSQYQGYKRYQQDYASQQQDDGGQQQSYEREQQDYKRQYQGYASTQQSDGSQQQGDGSLQQGYRRYQQGYSSWYKRDGNQQQSQACQQQDYGGQQQGYRSQQQGYKRYQQDYTSQQQDDGGQQLSYEREQQGYRRQYQGYASQQQSDWSQQQGDGSLQQGYTRFQFGYASQQSDDGGQQQGQGSQRQSKRRQYSKTSQQQDGGSQQQDYGRLQQRFQLNCVSYSIKKREKGEIEKQQKLIRQKLMKYLKHLVILNIEVKDCGYY